MLYLQEKFEASLNELGFAFMLPLVVSAILPKYIGAIGDKYGRVKSMIISLFISSCLYILFPNFNSIIFVAILYCLLNSFGTLLSTSSNAIFSLETDTETRGATIGM